MRILRIILISILVGSGLSPALAVDTPSPPSSPSASPKASPSATSPVIAIAKKPDVVFAGQTYVISGGIKNVKTPTPKPSASASSTASPTPSYLPVKVQQLRTGTWTTFATAKVNKRGYWTLTLVAPPQFTYLSLRLAYGAVTSIPFDVRILTVPPVTVAGPGARIAGVDISRYQHSTLPINFRQMNKSGITFVFIKASDGSTTDDSITRAYANSDSARAKSAGMYIGFYHFARIPSSNSSAVIISSAQKQARQALSRLAELGGYNGKTLPYVLDIESAPKGTTRASITLWARTWLDEMYTATTRRSIVYSYRYFLSSKFLTDDATKDYLRQSPLWLAHPGNPGNPKIIPGRVDSGIGCYQSAWTLPDCSASWSFWQYTSTGDRELYGIPWSPARGTKCPTNVKFCSIYVGQPRRHLDMNVFSGSATDLMALAQGTWTQAPKVVVTPSPTPNPTPSP